MRIASYNILDGGLGRLDPLAETLRVIDADLLVLQEACDPAGAAYLAGKCGYESFLAESRNSDYHVALLSRWPIRRAVNLSVAHDRLKRSAVEAVVDVGGQPLRLIGVHLAPGIESTDEQHRIAAMDAVLGAIDADAMPTALVGDFNCHAPWHPINEDAAPSSRTAQCRAAAAGANARLMPRLADAGWIDAHHRRLGDTVPHTLEAARPCLRVDYILANAALADRLAAAGVEQRGFAPYCSDHLPVWADFQMTGPSNVR